jgi:ankyrin repeat protein
MAEILLSRGVDVNGRASHNGETPLHYAALYGHRKVIALLAANGAELDSADNSGVRPLQYAMKRKRTLAVDMLLGLGARSDDLHDAVNAGDVARVQALIAAGADVNALNLTGTPLHLAAATGQLMIAEMLVNAGADLEAECVPTGVRPLHTAAIHNRTEAAQFLVDRGADMEAPDAHGKTPLAVAAAYGNVEAAATRSAGKSTRPCPSIWRSGPAVSRRWDCSCRMASTST